MLSCWLFTQKPGPLTALLLHGPKDKKGENRALVCEASVDLSSKFMSEKIWANSADSHLVEPPNLFTDGLPAHFAERMPRSEWDEDGRWETVYVDNQSFRRRVPRARDFTDSDGKGIGERAPGANDMKLRLGDLDQDIQ